MPRGTEGAEQQLGRERFLHIHPHNPRKALKPHVLLSIHKGLRKVVPCLKNYSSHNTLRPRKMPKKNAYIPQIRGRSAISVGNQEFWRTAASISAHNSQVLLFAWD